MAEITVKLSEITDAFAVVSTMVAARNSKDACALVRVEDQSMFVCYSDGLKRFVRKIEVSGEAENKSFMVSIDKTLGILNAYIPKDGIEADTVEIVIEEGILNLKCEQKLSADKFDESLAGKVVSTLKNQIAIDNTDNPRYGIITRANYDEILTDNIVTDKWSASELKAFMSNLQIDKATKNIYISKNSESAFALGSNQLSMYAIQPISYGFCVDIGTAKIICGMLSKISADSKDTVKVWTTEEGKYINFLSDDGTMGMWVPGANVVQGDSVKVGLYTNDSLAYDTYKGSIVKAALDTIVTSIMCADAKDNQKIDIVNIGTKPEIILSAKGTSGSNTFSASFEAFKSTVTDEMHGSIVVKTLKDILGKCCGTFIKISIQDNKEYYTLKVEDFETEENGGNTLVSTHYTIISK